jgi:hypothetical protein
MSIITGLVTAAWASRITGEVKILTGVAPLVDVLNKLLHKSYPMLAHQANGRRLPHAQPSDSAYAGRRQSTVTAEVASPSLVVPAIFQTASVQISIT